LLYEVTPNGATTNVLVHHYDYRGSTVALTDGSGNITDRVSYSPYGSITARSGSTDTPFLFNGNYGVQTEANGLLNMRARFYNPTICRFMNPDPSGFHGGLNRYAHVRGNPVSMTDPFGLCAETPYQDVSRSELIQYSEIQSILENEALNEDRKGIQSRDFDLFALVLVGTQPLTEFGVGEAAENAPVVIGEPTSTQLEFAFARGAAVQTPGLTQAGELFVRVGATEESTIVTSGSYAMPESTFNAIGRNPSALKDALDLPGSPPKYFRYFSPRAGTPIQRGIVPGGQYGGQGGYDEVIFP
jgi:RHS repeat-associated protein